MKPLTTLDQRDAAFIATLVETVVSCKGRPWRVALERLDVQLDGRFQSNAILSALARFTGSAKMQARVARRARELVLGAPAFTFEDRRERIGAAARELGVVDDEVENLLWADLPRERPVVFPTGIPRPIDVAALANVHVIQSALRRAQLVRLRMWGDDGNLLRTALRRGLLANPTRGPRGSTQLEILGPLSLFHRTSIYSRVLAQLVPFLAACERFELELDCVSDSGGIYTSVLRSPVLLPRAGEPLPPAVISRLVRELRKAAPDLGVRLGPAPIVTGDALACPDLVLDELWYVEVVGFWTADYLAAKLERYRAAGITRVILCVDETRACDDEVAPPFVVPFKRRIDPNAIIDRLGD